MRIGIDARLWNETGVGRYIRNLVSELARIDTKNEYVLFFKKEEYDNYIIPQNNFKKCLANYQWHTVAEQLFFPYIIKKERIDIMHFPYFSFPLLYNKPFVLTIHDLILHNFPTGKSSTKSLFYYKSKLLAYKFLLHKGAHFAKKIITVSQASKKEIVNRFHVPTQKVVVTYESLDPHIVFNAKNDDKKKEKYFLYVGNSYPHKNLSCLITAFMHIQKLYPDIRLKIVGREDFFLKKTQSFVKIRNVKNIEFLTDISDNELALLYTHALALVAPSLMEGFGLPGLEAMAKNCLVLASDIPSFKEIYSDVALYFNPLDSNDLAQKMMHIYTNSPKTFDSNRREGIIRVKQFSWTRMAKETLAVYESCIRI